MGHFLADILRLFVTLLYPPTLCSILLLIALLFYRKCFSKYFVLIALGYFYFSANGVLPALLAAPLETPFQRVNVTEIKKHNAMIVLGAGVNPYPNEINLSLIASARILEAARIYHVAQKNYVQYRIVLTGGDVQKKSISEAKLYKQWLVQLGVPQKNIFTENKSNNTYQNAQFTKKILEEQNINNVLLVTNAAHMPRSLKLFRRFGIDVTAAPSDFPYPKVGVWPLGYNLAIMHLVLHEYFGMGSIVAYDLLGLNN